VIRLVIVRLKRVHVPFTPEAKRVYFVLGTLSFGICYALVSSGLSIDQTKRLKGVVTPGPIFVNGCQLCSSAYTRANRTENQKKGTQ